MGASSQWAGDFQHGRFMRPEGGSGVRGVEEVSERSKRRQVWKCVPGRCNCVTAGL